MCYAKEVWNRPPRGRGGSTRRPWRLEREEDERRKRDSSRDFTTACSQSMGHLDSQGKGERESLASLIHKNGPKGKRPGNKKKC